MKTGSISLKTSDDIFDIEVMDSGDIRVAIDCDEERWVGMAISKEDAARLVVFLIDCYSRPLDESEKYLR